MSIPISDIALNLFKSSKNASLSIIKSMISPRYTSLAMMN